MKIKKSNELSSNGKKLNSISTNSSYYPTRAGIILVTTDGSFGSLVGHAGIIWSSKTTIESFPSTGVKKFKNDWDSRYKKVWAVTTKKLKCKSRKCSIQLVCKPSWKTI